MGYNRSGRRFKDRIKRAKRLDNRLAAKAEHHPKGVAEAVTDLAKGIVEKVGGAVKSAVATVTGKGS